MNLHRSLASIAILGAAAALLPACGDRESLWDKPVAPLVAHGLAGSVGLVDVNGERVLMLPVEGDLTVAPVSIPIRRGFAASAVSPEGASLLVLSRGDVPREKPGDQGPALAIIDGTVTPRLARTYEISDPLSGLAVDPEGRFAVVYPSAADTAFVANPNELAIADISKEPGASNPTSLTLRSFGGRPQSLVFTPELALPGGARRLLAVLTDRDVGLIDLSAPEKGDITVRLSSSGAKVTPAQLAFTDGDPARNDDARLAIRLANDPSVILVDLEAQSSSTTAHDFRPAPNVVLASGPPSDVAFVNTDGGLRLAALVPSKQSITLIDPATGIAKDVALGAPFEHLSLVTGIVGGTASGADVALLWSTSSRFVAFVALGSTVGKPYKSVEKLELEQSIAEVLDVPAPNDRLKILAAAGGRSFFVLDLIARTASPIESATFGVDVHIAPDGVRAWLFEPHGSNLAALDLENLHPQNFVLTRQIAAAFDVGRRDGGRALVAVHPVGDVGLTVLDAQHPSLQTAVQYGAVLLGSLR